MRLPVFDALRLAELCSEATTRLSGGPAATGTPDGGETYGRLRVGTE